MIDGDESNKLRNRTVIFEFKIGKVGARNILAPDFILEDVSLVEVFRTSLRLHPSNRIFFLRFTLTVFLTYFGQIVNKSKRIIFYIIYHKLDQESIRNDALSNENWQAKCF